MTTSPASVISSAELEPVCSCRSWCRSDLWGQMIDGHKYPAPNHADGCSAQKREPFTVVEFDGARCTMEPEDAAQMLAESADPAMYSTSTVMLTRDQFERMEDFAGF